MAISRQLTDGALRYLRLSDDRRGIGGTGTPLTHLPKTRDHCAPFWGHVAVCAKTGFWLQRSARRRSNQSQELPELGPYLYRAATSGRSPRRYSFWRISMARPFWTGQIQISLVSFGVSLFPATETKSEIRFHRTTYDMAISRQLTDGALRYLRLSDDRRGIGGTAAISEP